MSLEAIAALLGHKSLAMTMTYAKIADRTVAEEYFAVTDKVEALYDNGNPALPADAEGSQMLKLRKEMTQRMLGNGYCARPVEMDCHFESICESCTFFVTTIEFRPTLQKQRDDAAAKHQIGRQKVFDGLLEQNVPGWRTQLATLAATVTGPNGPLTPDRVAELMMGRAKDGTPLAAPIDPTRGLGADANDFDYANDPAGTVTPCAAHIRKTHPRSFAPSPRTMRRGIPFGAPFDTDPTGKRGLVFNCFVTSIEDQFEFIQQSWANSPGFSGGGGPTGPDPVIGNDGQVNLALADGTHCAVSVTRAVVTAGAVYGLALSIPTLHALATGGQLPA